MAGKLVDIFHQLGFPRLGGSPANPATKGDVHASHLSLEGTQDQFTVLNAVKAGEVNVS